MFAISSLYQSVCDIFAGSFTSSYNSHHLQEWKEIEINNNQKKMKLKKC